MFGLNKVIFEKTPKCKHYYSLNDYYTTYINNGCDVDLEERYVLYCCNCETTRTVNQYDYNRMKELGLIKG